jgi:tetrahydromethanopterin S-methyltransferase subunit D
VAPRDIPNWERGAGATSWPESRWEHATQTTLPVQSTRPGPDRGQRHQSRAPSAGVAVAFLVLILIAGAVVLASLHHAPKAPTGPAAATTSTVSDSDVERMLTATIAAGAANTLAQSKLQPGSGFPTVTKVAGIINPYVASLQRYKTALADIPVPEGVRPDAVNAHALVTRDLQFLGTINGLPSLRLGTYLEEFHLDAAQLQSILGSLQRELNAPSF